MTAVSPIPMQELPRYESYENLSDYNYSNGYDHAYDLPPPPPPPPRVQQPSVDPYKFKTKLCKNFANGTCQFGERCAFAHGELEVRDTPPPTHERQNSAAAEDDLMAPPSYSDFVGQSSDYGVQAMTPSELSRPSTPPQGPSHYRYDPYTPQGFIYCDAPTPSGSPSKCPSPLL